MATIFQPLANLKDFERAADPAAMHASWHAKIDGVVRAQAALFPAFFHPLHPPTPNAPETRAPAWTGLPLAIKRLVRSSIGNAAKFVDNPVAMGQPDPIFGRFTQSFLDASNHRFEGPAYRPQDEYLEWVTRRDPDGTITEILFTCEGPEYWDTIAEDQTLLLTLYQELLGDTTIPLADLLFPQKVSWKNPNKRGAPDVFQAGQYNPYNKWNIRGAVHLTQPANTLGAEISLAKAATLLYGNPVPVTTDPDLVCCAGYGEPNRMSDPTIGSGVNTFVRGGKRVTLRNPIGLYIKSINEQVFTHDDGSPFLEAKDCFEPIRPAKADVTDMIVRARFRVPNGLMFNGKQLRVGDLKVRGEKIDFGGQVADAVTMTLFAQTLPGAPQQTRIPCDGRPCHDPVHPDFINVMPFGSTCPQGGVSPLVAHLVAPAVPLQSADVPVVPPLAIDGPGPLHRARKGG